jgi:hypothetical protein
MLVAITLAVFVCAGCAYEVTLIPRDGGQSSTSTVKVESIGEAFSGPIELIVDGFKYRGTYVSSLNDYGFTLLKTYCPRHRDVSRKLSDWYGQATLKETLGRTLRCEYIGSSSKGGYGVCVSNEGGVYDMIISR